MTKFEPPKYLPITSYERNEGEITITIEGFDGELVAEDLSPEQENALAKALTNAPHVSTVEDRVISFVEDKTGARLKPAYKNMARRLLKALSAD